MVADLSDRQNARSAVHDSTGLERTILSVPSLNIHGPHDPSFKPTPAPVAALTQMGQAVAQNNTAEPRPDVD
jgi:hypothetical protein